MTAAQRRYSLVKELRSFLDSNGGPNWRTRLEDLPINFDYNTDTSILVDVRKADLAWCKPQHVNFRISAQGQNEIGDRTELLVQYLKSGGTISPPEAYYCEETGGLDFSDGRHRFSLLRDVGLLVIPMISDSLDTLRNLEADLHLLKKTVPNKIRSNKDPTVEFDM